MLEVDGVHKGVALDMYLCLLSYPLQVQYSRQSTEYRFGGYVTSRLLSILYLGVTSLFERKTAYNAAHSSCSQSGNGWFRARCSTAAYPRVINSV